MRYFVRTYKDRVVEYFRATCCPGIRVTARYERVFVHREIYDHSSGNMIWQAEPVVFVALYEAEQYALKTYSNSESVSITPKVQEKVAHYVAA